MGGKGQWWRHRQAAICKFKLFHCRLPVGCQINSDLKFWGSTFCSKYYCFRQSSFNLFQCLIQVNCQVSFWCVAFWGSSNCSNNFIYWTPWPRLQVDSYLQLDKNIPYLLRRLHNILWGRVVANNNKDAWWFYLSFQFYRHEGFWPQQAHQAHQLPRRWSQQAHLAHQPCWHPQLQWHCWLNWPWPQRLHWPRPCQPRQAYWPHQPH